MGKKISVLIVDDSAVVRKVLAAALEQDPVIEVIATAADPLFAQQKMARRWPDVIVLDVEMPRMDGITFLKKLMKERPTPVIICSTLTEKGAAVTVEALAAGAVEAVAKPATGLKHFLESSGGLLIRAIKAAAHARVRVSGTRVGPLFANPERDPATSAVGALALGALAKGTVTKKTMVTDVLERTTDSVIAIGTSTGGTQALQVVLTALPKHCPGVVVVQHMPEKFTTAFAERLDKLCACEVKEAENGDRVRTGRVLIAPGGRHMQLKRNGAQYMVQVLDGPPVNRHKPSVDVLFRSVAKTAGKSAVGIIMTGMGDDGARGLLEMREAGALTAAQDEFSCVVFGMPREAIKLGAAERIIPLHELSDLIMARR